MLGRLLTISALYSGHSGFRTAERVMTGSPPTVAKAHPTLLERMNLQPTRNPQILTQPVATPQNIMGGTSRSDPTSSATQPARSNPFIPLGLGSLAVPTALRNLKGKGKARAKNESDSSGEDSVEVTGVRGLGSLAGSKLVTMDGKG